MPGVDSSDKTAIDSEENKKNLGLVRSGVSDFSKSQTLKTATERAGNVKKISYLKKALSSKICFFSKGLSLGPITILDLKCPECGLRSNYKNQKCKRVCPRCGEELKQVF